MKIELSNKLILASLSLKKSRNEHNLSRAFLALDKLRSGCVWKKEKLTLINFKILNSIDFNNKLLLNT